MPTADCIGASQKALGGSTAKARQARQAKEAGFKYGVETMSDVLDTQQQEFKAKKRTLQNKMQLHQKPHPLYASHRLDHRSKLKRSQKLAASGPEQLKEAVNKS